MKKNLAFSKSLGHSVNALTTAQMSVIRGGAAITGSDPIDDPTQAPVQNAVGPTSATADEKRRDRPGGGISTH